jgi:hypothetical protein
MDPGSSELDIREHLQEAAAVEAAQEAAFVVRFYPELARDAGAD